MSPPRAAPLAPDERRASIITAALPLLRRYGKDATTAQIAMAAGVAEGTLFRVFPDKESLIAAALQVAFDPAPTERELRAIDPARSLRDKLIVAVEILANRVAQIWQLMAILEMQVPVTDRKPREPAPPGMSDPGIGAAMLALFAGHEAELRCSPAYAMRCFRMFAFVSTHPRLADGEPLASAEIVAVILDGVRTRDEAA